MDWERFTNDELERELAASRAARSRLDAHDMEILEVLDARQAAAGDGCRSLSEWVASRLDIGIESAKTLTRTMRRTGDRPDLRDLLASGDISFDRIEALSRIPEDVGLLEHLDVAGIRRQAALRTRITSEMEFRTSEDRFLVLQPTLDQSWWRLFGGLDGASGAVVDKVLNEMADQLPPPPDGIRGGSSWRKATALVELAIADSPPTAQVSVFVDANQATESSGQAGVMLEAGPRVGRDALETILCDAVTEVSVRAEDGTPMSYGRRIRTVPPALRRAILHRDGNACSGDGCTSRHRLQVHHIIPWSQGGPTDPSNLITLCWFHHHVVVHERGFQIVRHPDHGRIRFKPPPPRPPDRT